MLNIPEPAEDCKRIPTANHTRNSVALTESALPISQGVSGGNGDKPGKIHSFSRSLAREIYAKKRERNAQAKHATGEATLLKYLAHRVHQSKHVHGGRKWFFDTTEDLAERFPYLGSTTVHDLVVSLKRLGYLETGNFNRKSYDRTNWFHVPDQVRHAAEADPVYFDAEIASAVGIPAAVLQRNFDYHIQRCQETGEDLRVKMSPAVLSDLLPFSESTIKGALKKLEGKYLQKLSVHEPTYGLIAAEKGSYPNGKGSYPNDGGSYPNDYTYWKQVINPLETRSKGKPAASPCKPSSGVGKADQPPAHSSHGCIAAVADEQEPENMGPDQVTVSASTYAGIETKALAPFSISPSICITSFLPISTASSTVNIAGEAGNGNGKWPVVKSLVDLHVINGSNAQIAEALTGSADGLQKFRETVQRLSSLTLALMDLTISDQLYETPDAAEALRVVLPLFHQHLDQHPLDQAGVLFELLYYGALECMVGAFLWPRENGDSYSHPVHPLISVTHNLHLVLWRRAEDAREAAVKEEFQQRRKEYPGVDAGQEQDAELAPAQKARVFRNGLSSMNEVGWIGFDQTHRTHQITGINRPALKLVEKLFEINPQSTASDLLKIMRGCMDAYVKQPAPAKPQRRKDWYPPKGVKWHARMGHHLLFFITNLHHIVNQLGTGDSACPVETFLRDIKEEEDKAKQRERRRKQC